MRAINIFRRLLGRIAERAVVRRTAGFVCADCERWARCGLASSDDCVVRAAQIARGDWKMRRRARAASFVMGWPIPSID
jgi:hypothetical protein